LDKLHLSNIECIVGLRVAQRHPTRCTGVTGLLEDKKDESLVLAGFFRHKCL